MAIAVRSTLIKARPADPLAKRAHYLIGANYHRLAWYSRAAEHYERFALRYPGEREAPDALQNAIVFRLGRGELELALDDARAFARYFAAQPRRAAQAAAVAFSLGRIHEERGDSDATIRHYAHYLRSWGARGGVDRQARAHVAIGEALWRRSCPTPGLLGACVRRESARRSATEARAAGQCGPGHRTLLVARGPEARRAQQHFREALALARGLASPAAASDEDSRRRGSELRQATAAARFHQAEALFEAALRIELPRDLSLASRDRRQAVLALRSFARYLEEKGRALAAATQAYREVITMKEPHHAIAAAARIGQLHQELADALYTAPVPRPPIPPALAKNAAARKEFVETFRTRYCDGLGDKAGPLAEKAEEGLKACLHTARDLSWYNEWSRFCEAALHELKPAAYPLAAEIRAQPGYVSLRADRAGPITVLR